MEKSSWFYFQDKQTVVNIMSMLNTLLQKFIYKYARTTNI